MKCPKCGVEDVSWDSLGMMNVKNEYSGGQDLSLFVGRIDKEGNIVHYKRIYTEVNCPKCKSRLGVTYVLDKTITEIKGE